MSNSRLEFGKVWCHLNVSIDQNSTEKGVRNYMSQNRETVINVSK